MYVPAWFLVTPSLPVTTLSVSKHNAPSPHDTDLGRVGEWVHQSHVCPESMTMHFGLSLCSDPRNTQEDTGTEETLLVHKVWSSQWGRKEHWSSWSFLTLTSSYIFLVIIMYHEVPGEVCCWECLSWANGLRQSAALSHLHRPGGHGNIPEMPASSILPPGQFFVVN